MDSMKRTPEPELMLEEAQVRAYSAADFDEAHHRFIDLLRKIFPDEKLAGLVLDLGCGTADITLRFAGSFPDCRIHGVDGSEYMLCHARRAVLLAGLQEQVQLIHGYRPGARLSCKKYDVVISNSLLHHLKDPQVLWESIKQFSRPGASVLVMDLVRPSSRERATKLVRTYVLDEQKILKRDFSRSLLAAYRPEEIRKQLKEAGLLHFKVDIVSDRHVIVWGYIQGSSDNYSDTSRLAGASIVTLGSIGSSGTPHVLRNTD